jgi:hypothetical protein
MAPAPPAASPEPSKYTPAPPILRAAEVREGSPGR